MQDFVLTNIPEVDDFLQGGIPSGKITHVYGVAGSGKTTFVLKLAAMVALQKSKVIYIDSGNQFDSERLRQICGDTFPEVSKKIMVIQPEDFLEQSEIIDRLESFIDENVRLIIVDTLTALYRKSLTKDKERTVVYHQELNRQIAVLFDSAIHHHIPLVLINQVTAKPEILETVPVAPSILKYWGHITICLELDDTRRMGARSLTVTHGNQSKTVRLIINQKGLVPFEPDIDE